MYIIGNTRTLLELKAKKFSDYIATDEITSATIYKARQKIKYTVFQEIFERTSHSVRKKNAVTNISYLHLML